ncbi:collagenase 3-like isoform X2 [Dendropsophus ebraccatus]|uniref:collagenase 3-like isoform X2 n=1 Tax=Dendropsophus ebraccatus TaxID=150705 RepID=UPI0038317335
MRVFLVSLRWLLLSITNALPIMRDSPPDSEILPASDLQDGQRYKKYGGYMEAIQKRDVDLNRGHYENDNTMDEPRCGVPDVAQYAVIEKDLKWVSTIITYRIVNYSPDLPPADVDQNIQDAFNVWSAVTPLQFIRLHSGHADLMVVFAARDYNLFSVAVHELGHSLGLAHSSSPSALMYPIYTYYSSENFTLPADDVLGIQELYGPRPSSVVTPTICSQEVPIDAMVQWKGGVIIFKDRHVWYHHPNLPVHKAILATSLWEEVPDFIDAAYSSPGQNTILLFKGRQVWSVNGFYPKVKDSGNISDFGFPETVMRIDAALHDGEKGKTFFFTGDQCWSYDEQTRQMDHGFPMLLESQFSGVGNKVDAAYMHENGNMYFYHGETQIEYDPRIRHVTDVREKFFVLC